MAPPEPERPSVSHWWPFAASLMAMTGHCPQETALRFPPEDFLGGFLLTASLTALARRL